MKKTVLPSLIFLLFGFPVLANFGTANADTLVANIDAIAEVTCFGGTDGAITLSVQGTEPITFQWSNGATTQDLSGLPAGLYGVTVTDSTGTLELNDITVGQPAELNLSLFVDAHPGCNGQAGAISSEVIGGVPGFGFAWSNGSDEPALTGLAEGTFTLIVTDANGCTVSGFAEVVLDTLAPTVDAGADLTVACTNSETALAGNASGSTNFAYLWSAADGGRIAAGETTLAPTIDLAGTFIFTATNLDNNCSASDTLTVTGTNEPPVAQVLGGELTCLLTEATLSATADLTDKIYGWSGPNGFISNELEITVDTAGDYTFTLTDTLTACSANFIATVEDNTGAPALEVEGGSITCTTTSLELTAMTSSPDAVFLWTGPGAFISTAQNPTVSTEGSYELVLTDTITGCLATASATVALDTVAPIADAGAGHELTCANPSIDLDGNASSQGNDFAYAWTTVDGNFAAGENTLSPTVDAAGIYTLTVTNLLNGCTATAEVAITANFTAPSVEAFGGTFTCFDGGLQLLATFDTLHVNFGWSGPDGFASAEENPFVTSPGDYVLTVTDTLNGCTASAVAIVEKLGVDPVLTTTGGTLTCAEPNLQLTVEAQIEGIIWSWANDTGFSSGEQNPIVTEPGTYSVLAIDTVFGCIALDTSIVEIDTVAPSADAGAGLAFNCQVSSAVLQGTASTGADFSFVWSTADGNFAAGENTLNPTVDATGTYTLTVSNALNGCTAASSVIILQTPAVTAAASVVPVACFGTATGSATVAPNGGVGNFTYAWTSGATSATATDLVVGDYTVTVTDGDGCTATATVAISQPNVLEANAFGMGQSLAGVNDGTATASPSGGTAPYTFEWSNGDTTQSLSGLAPGAYSVVVTDANGCTDVSNANVNAFPCVLTSSITGVNVSCFGAADGEATATLANAEGQLTFAWSNGDTLATATGLAAGVYTVVVSDSTNCQNTLTVVIDQPTEIVISELFHVDVECPGQADGFVIVGVNGGAQPYLFNWSNGSSNAVASGLGTGSYELVVTDDLGCEQTLITNISATDSEGPTMALFDATILLDENGLASITASQLDAGISDNCSTVTLAVSQTDFDCSQLGAQSVTVTATDASGNSSSATALVTVVDTQAPELTCPEDIVRSACDPQVEFELPTATDNCGIDPAQLQLTAGLAAGSVFPVGMTVQTYAYTDAAGNTGECSFEIVLVDTLESSFSLTPASCADLCDGSISLALSQGLPPYQILWSNGETDASLTGLCAGSYTATITDAGGCEINMTMEIEAPAALAVEVTGIENPTCPTDQTGAVTVAATGGTAPYSFEWSTGANGDAIANVSAGTYDISVTDMNGCALALSVEVAATDAEAPLLNLQDAVASLASNGSVVLDPASFDAGSSDNCAIVSWTVSPNSFGCDQLGQQAVTITATDASGNSASATATVTIEDASAPVLTCPANITVGFCNPSVMFLPAQVQDNCDVTAANLQLTTGLASGSAFPTGNTVQTYSYTDAGGNTGTCTFTVTVLEASILSAMANEVTCAGECDGEITLSVSSNAGPFAITWSNGQTGQTATGLCPGPHSAIVTDAAGCLQTFTTTLNTPAPVILTIDQVVNQTGTTATGGIQISVTGGTAPYSYAWTFNGQTFTSTTQDLTGLLAGDYEVVVTDANGCEVASGIIVVEDLTTGTAEAVWATGLTIYPNPAAEWTKLRFAGPLSSPLEGQLLDVTGKTVRSFFLKNGETETVLDLAGLPSGIYTIYLSTAKGRAVRRMVIGE